MQFLSNLLGFLFTKKQKLPGYVHILGTNTTYGSTENTALFFFDVEKVASKCNSLSTVYPTFWYYDQQDNKKYIETPASEYTIRDVLLDYTGGTLSVDSIDKMAQHFMAYNRYRKDQNLWCYELHLTNLEESAKPNKVFLTLRGTWQGKNILEEYQFDLKPIDIKHLLAIAGVN